MMTDDDKELYRKRRQRYFVLTISTALSWYVVTGIESWQMGLHPLTRRFFTLFDALYFIFVLAVIFLVQRWYRKCPKCGGNMAGYFSPVCRSCKFGLKQER